MRSAAASPSDPLVGEPQIGQLFAGRYRLTRLIGRGGMGQVFEAQDTQNDDRAVAVKVLLPDRSHAEDASHRFLREARVVSRLRHPNVVALLDSGQDQQRLYLVLELVAGGSAEDRIQQSRLPWREATRIIADVCRGLIEAHAAGLIHRDIKPGNILLSSDGMPKLADFGLVKLADDGTRALTATGEIVGTPHFMSPEQCQSAPVDARADLYSLGMTWYALLTGEAPFAKTQMSTVQLMYAH